MKIPIVGRIWPFISAFAKTLLAAPDQASAQSILGVSGGGSGAGDMTKAIYDPQNIGYISGSTSGGFLRMDGAPGGIGGNVDTRAVLTAPGGNVYTFGGGGDVDTSIGGGAINTSNGGGSINTAGTGVIQLGVSGSRTAINGTATTDREQSLVDADGIIVITGGGTSGNLASFSATSGKIADSMISAADVVSAITAAGTALQSNSSINGTSGINDDTRSGYEAGDAATLAAAEAYTDAAMSADTGWTANQSVGDKTVAVQDYDSTTLDGMTAALNLVLAGFGTATAQLADQVEALTKKVQALEAALANALRPNA